MKKIIILLVILLLACGCSSKDTTNAKLSDEVDTTYFEYDGKKYTKNDVFQRLKAQSVGNALEMLVAKQALDAEGHDFEEDRATYEEQYDLVISYYGEDMVKQYYGEKDDFVEMCFLNDAPNIYITNYIKNRLSTYLTKYPSQYVEYVVTSDKAKAEKLQKLVKNGTSFDDAVEKVKFENSETVNKVVTTDDEATFPDVIKEEYKNLEVGKVSKVLEYKEEAQESTEESTEESEPTYSYYVIRIISNDPENEYKDEFISYVIAKEAITSIFQIIDEDHKVNFYDDDFLYTYNKLAPKTAE